MNRDTLDLWAPRVLSILRIVAALIFLEHGAQKLLGFPAHPSPPGIWTTSWVAAVLEIVGGPLLALGLFTRPVAFILSGEMAVAYWMAHAPRGVFPVLNGGDAAILYCFGFLYFVFAGAGPASPGTSTSATSCLSLAVMVKLMKAQQPCSRTNSSRTASGSVSPARMRRSRVGSGRSIPTRWLNTPWRKSSSRPAYSLGCRVQAIGPSGAGAGLWTGTLVWDMATSTGAAGRAWMRPTAAR